MPKRRTREHVISDLSINFVEKQVLLAGFVAERQIFDYGYDLQVTTFDDVGEVEPGHLFVQVKATDHLHRSPYGEVLLRVERRDLERWCREWIPVLLVLYDAREDKAYVEVIHRSHLTAATATTTTLRLVAENLLNANFVLTLAQEKRQIQMNAEERLHGTD
jgi:hypothetical protein